MRVTFLGHACHLVEIDGRRVLTDPWLVDPIFEGCCEHGPELRFGPADLPPLDAIAITHAHLDHLNAPTLWHLPDKSIPVIFPHAAYTELEDVLRRLGFENLAPRRPFEPFALGGARVVPTPAPGVFDECAYVIEGRGGRFFDGADAPQPPALMAEIAGRLGAPDLGAFSHNSFDMPALLGVPSQKPAEHGPLAAARAAAALGCPAAFAGASSMRWRGPDGDALTARVIRCGPGDLRDALAREAPGTAFLDLAPGDAWTREGGVERRTLRGKPAPPAAHDYLHAFLDTGERHCPPGRPTSEASFRRDLPARCAAAPAAARELGQAVCFELEGEDAGSWSFDFAAPGRPAERGDSGAPFALRLPAEDWKDLFERRSSWQVLLASGRLRVLRFRPGAPPEGLHFVYALQALFP